MAFKIIEGIDRSGKTSLADSLKEQGYIVVHMSAPDKKYTKPGYTGPSYIDECIETYLSLDGKDVVFDRSIYGEMVWPHVYGRDPQINFDESDDGFATLREIEANNSTEYILMTDPNIEAHWQRCLNNKEPLTRDQFNKAYTLYESMAKKFNFNVMTLNDVVKPNLKQVEETAVASSNIEKDERQPHTNKQHIEDSKLTDVQFKLETANAINLILSSRIIKKNGNVFESIENDIRVFLRDKLRDIFNDTQDNKDQLTAEEIFIFKKYVERLKSKMEDKS